MSNRHYDLPELLDHWERGQLSSEDETLNLICRLSAEKLSLRALKL